MRSFPYFPIPFLISLSLFAMLVFFHRRRGCGYLTGMIIFYAYISLVVYLMFFPIPIPENWPHNLSRAGMEESLSQINWIPFNYHIGGGIKADIRSGFRDVFLNVLLTVPIGMGFGFLFKRRWYLALLAAPLVGLAFEGTQLLIKILTGLFYHSVDATDVVTNASGVIAGAALFYITARAVRHFKN